MLVIYPPDMVLDSLAVCNHENGWIYQTLIRIFYKKNARIQGYTLKDTNKDWGKEAGCFWFRQNILFLVMFFFWRVNGGLTPAWTYIIQNIT